MSTLSRIAASTVLIGAVLAALFSMGAFAYYWDPSRVLLKRVTESDPYKYETVDPKLLARNPVEHIKIATTAGAAATRAALTASIWGSTGLPVNKFPESIEADLLASPDRVACSRPAGDAKISLSLDCVLDRYRGIANLRKLDRLTANIHSGYRPEIAYFQPKQANGRLVVYHHGFAGTYHENYRHIERLVDAGYAVMAHNLMGYGDNVSGIKGREREHLLEKPRPMRFFYEPIVISINYALRDKNFTTVDMIGFSVGGYIAAVAAAVDTRIRRTFAVASPFPLFLRESRQAGPTISRYPSLIRAAGILDTYVLAAIGENRSLTLIHNRYDRCCWGNLTAALSEDAVSQAVRAAGGGRFQVRIDESHARHKISGLALRAIMREMAAP